MMLVELLADPASIKRYPMDDIIAVTKEAAELIGYQAARIAELEHLLHMDDVLAVLPIDAEFGVAEAIEFLQAADNEIVRKE